MGILHGYPVVRRRPSPVRIEPRTSGSGGVSCDCAITAGAATASQTRAECYAGGGSSWTVHVYVGMAEDAAAAVRMATAAPLRIRRRRVPMPSRGERHRPAAGTIRVAPPRVPQRRQCGSLQFRHSCTPLRLGLPQVLSPPPPASDSSRVLNCLKLTSAPPSIYITIRFMAAPLGQHTADEPLRLARDDEGRARCVSCEWAWRPRVEAPVLCPRCKSPRWFRAAYPAGRRAQPKAPRVYQMSID